MRHEVQIELTRRIFDYIDGRTTALAEAAFQNEVGAYTSTERFEREQRLLFREHPQLVALSCDLRRPGDVITHDATGVPLFLVRTESGGVRAFLNVCRHRGGRVVAGSCAGRRDFMCAYHGWTYDQDGTLIAIPEARSFPGIDRAKHRLVPLPVVENYGLIWVRPLPGEPFEVDAMLGGLEDDLASYRLDGYHHYKTRTVRRRLNWKLVCDTFLETYHFATLHAATVGPIFHTNLNAYDPFGRNGRLVGVRKSIAALRTTPEHEWDLIPHTGIVNLLFPNSVLVQQGDHVELWNVYPADGRIDEAAMTVALYSPDPIDEKAARHWDANLDLLLRTVENEDFPMNEHILRGCEIGAQPYLTYGRNEPGLIHYHRSLARALGYGDPARL